MTCNNQVDYNLKQLDSMRVRLNGRAYSENWYRRHFRGMLDELYKIKKEQCHTKDTHSQK